MFRDREKIVLILGAAAAALILLLSFVAIPGVRKARSLARQATLAERELAQVRAMRPELEALERDIQKKRGKIQARANEKESSVARLTSTLAEAGFPQSAVSLKAGGTRDGEFTREEAFDLSVENLTYLEAARLVARLESGPLPIVIRSARLKSRYDDARYLDATMRLGVLAPKGS